MPKVNTYEFRTHFAKYAKCVRDGETVTVCDRNQPFAELRKLPDTKPRHGPRPIGLYEGQIQMAPDFDAAEVNEEIRTAFTEGAAD